MINQYELGSTIYVLFGKPRLNYIKGEIIGVYLDPNGSEPIYKVLTDANVTKDDIDYDADVENVVVRKYGGTTMSIVQCYEDHVFYNVDSLKDYVLDEILKEIE